MMNTALRIRNLIPFLALSFFLLTAPGCAKKIVFQPSAYVPAATGKVKLKKDDNNNYSIQVSVDNLADAKRLNPPQNTYIVWATTKESGVKNIGQIKSSTNFITGKVKASLKAVSPFKPTRIFITAEPSNNVAYPGTQEVLTTRSF